MAKLSGEKTKEAPKTIKNRSKDVKCRIMFNPEYREGKNQKTVYISDIGEEVDATGNKIVYLPESTFNWLKQVGEERIIYEKHGSKVKKTNKKKFVPRFKIFREN